jgi:hypothetical protein
MKISHTLALSLLAVSLAGPAAAAASKAERAEAAATLRADLASCRNGQTKQTRDACVKEAHAAYGEALRGVLGDGMAEDSSNASKRCMALKGRDQDACMARMQGMGTTSGTAADGGIYRELSTTMPVRPAASAAR